MEIRALSDLETLAQARGIRRATLADVDDLLVLCKERYPDRDVDAARKWGEWCLCHPERLCLLGANSFGIARVEWMYGCERRSGIDMLVTRPGAGFEALLMLRLMLEWARRNGASGPFKLEADTGIDFGPFAARLGGKPSAARIYEIPL